MTPAQRRPRRPPGHPPAEGYPLDTPIDRIEFTVLDSETTGINAEEGRQISEPGMARYGARGKISETFEALVRPTRPLSPEALAVHKIPPEQIARARPLEERIDEVLAFIGGSVIAAHNVKFDLTFLHTALRALGRPVPGNRAIDTIELSRRMWPEMKCHCLMCMARRLDLPHQGTHRALEDVYATAELLDAVIVRLREEKPRPVLLDLSPVRGDFTWSKGDAHARLEAALACAIRRAWPVHIFLYDRNACHFTKKTVDPVRVENGSLFARVAGEEGEREFPLISIAKALAAPA